MDLFDHVMHLAPRCRPHGLKHGASPSMPIYKTFRNIYKTHSWRHKVSHKTFAYVVCFPVVALWPLDKT